MCVSGNRVVGVTIDARTFGAAMIDHIAMGKTMGRVLAMAEGECHGRHDEAKPSERRKDDREPEAKPGRELGQH